MRTIETIKIEKYNLLFQIVCGALIILACFSTKMLMWVAGLLSFLYIFSDTKWEQKIAFFMFMLSFSPIFKISEEQTSLFMFLRVAVVLSYVFKERRVFTSSFTLALILFFLYALLISAIAKNDYLVNLINIVLWIMIGYIIINTLNDDKMTPVVRSLSNSVIITGIIGLFAKNIPQLKENMTFISTVAEDGFYITRHAGFWPDPNFFTVILIASLFTLYIEFDKGNITITEFLAKSAIISFLALMTMSKSSVIALIIFWAYVFISKNDIKTAAKVVIFFAFVIAMAIFLAKNHYWVSDIMFRFTGGSDKLDSDVLTTGRTSIWGKYFAAMLEDGKWLYGNGINSELVAGKGSHNAIIQILYNLGLIGSVLYLSLFRLMYNSVLKSTPTVSKRFSPANAGLLTMVFLLMFLDCLSCENLYYLFSVMFVYVIGKNSVNSARDEKEKVYKKPSLNVVKEV